MIKRLKHIFKQSQMKFMCCVDTNFIEGTVLKIIEKESWKIEIKDDSRLKLLNECDCLIFVNDINIYEIKSKLLKDFNIPFDRLDEIYNSAMSYFVNIKRMKVEDIKISPPLINWMLKHRLGLKDGLLIDIAQKIELPFVTSERRAKEWKKAYSGIMSQEEFWSKIKEKQNP